MKFCMTSPISGNIVLDKRVEEMDLNEVRDLKLQLQRLLYNVVVREQELNPPPLNVHVVETIKTSDRVG